MIVDCYTHSWESSEQLGDQVPARGELAPAGQGSEDPSPAGVARHLAALEPVDAAIVLGFKSRYLNAEISNDHVATYVASHPDRLIGFAGVDPSHPKEAITDLHRARDELSMPGIAVAPAAQDFHPSNSQAMQVYAEAAERGMPVIFHTGVFVTSATKLEYARPVLLDEIARELPKLKIVIAHMGHPWVSETLVLLAKHENVFAETSRLVHQPWQAYQALLNAHQYNVMEKVLFGSGFPTAAPLFCIEALYSINHLVHGTHLPTIPRESLRGIVERDALSLLGINGPRPQPQLQPAATSDDEHTES